MKNTPTHKEKYPTQEVTYLGYIYEKDYMEGYAVIKLPQFEKPVIFFSPELSTAIAQVEPGEKMEVFFWTNSGSIIHDNNLKTKTSDFGEKTHNLMGELEFYPANLKDQNLLPYNKLSIVGPIIKNESGKYFVDSIIPITLKDEFFTKDKPILNIGDWVEIEYIQIYFS